MALKRFSSFRFSLSQKKRQSKARKEENLKLKYFILGGKKTFIARKENKYMCLCDKRREKYAFKKKNLLRTRMWKKKLKRSFNLSAERGDLKTCASALQLNSFHRREKKRKNSTPPTSENQP